jgi:hypothetical protein
LYTVTRVARILKVVERVSLIRAKGGGIKGYKSTPSVGGAFYSHTLIFIFARCVCFDEAPYTAFSAFEKWKIIASTLSTLAGLLILFLNSYLGIATSLKNGSSSPQINPSVTLSF